MVKQNGRREGNKNSHIQFLLIRTEYAHASGHTWVSTDFNAIISLTLTKLSIFQIIYLYIPNYLSIEPACIKEGLCPESAPSKRNHEPPQIKRE